MGLVLYFPFSCTVSALCFVRSLEKQIANQHHSLRKRTVSIFRATEFHTGIHSHLRRKQLCYNHWLFWAYLPIGLEQDLFPLPFLLFC